MFQGHGTWRTRWQCADCGYDFIPKAEITELQHFSRETADALAKLRKLFHEVKAENKQLKQELKERNQFLRDANSGAELNAKVNKLLIDEVTELKTKIKQLQE